MKTDNVKSTIKIGTFFSGIGAPEQALKKLKEEGKITDYKLEFFSEIDKNAIKSYCAIHNVEEKLNVGDITKLNGQYLPYCDLWIGGFPCQDISCAGKMKGFDFKSSTRSSLGWEMIRLLGEVKEKPKYVIFENVANIISKPFETTLNLFKSDLENLGYTIYESVLKASDYQIPQIRKRYFLIAILNKSQNFIFPIGESTNLIMKDFLEKEVEEKYYLTDYQHFERNQNVVIFNNKKNKEIKYAVDLNKFYRGGKCGEDMHCKFHQSARVFSQLGFVPTLTASNTVDNCKIVVDDNNMMRIRKITPKEAWRLMGFKDDDYQKARKVNSETSLYHQAGNSIVVNVIYVILKELLK